MFLFVVVVVVVVVVVCVYTINFVENYVKLKESNK